MLVRRMLSPVCLLAAAGLVGLQLLHAQHRQKELNQALIATIVDLRGQLRNSVADAKQCRDSCKVVQQHTVTASADVAPVTTAAALVPAVGKRLAYAQVDAAGYPEVDGAAKAASTLVKLGTAYGSWQFDGKKMSKDAVVYSVGLGQDISWDKALIEKYRCEVYGFDPTPKTIEYLRLDAQQKRLPARFHYTAEGLATDGPRNMTFTMPKDPAHVSMRAGAHDGFGDKVQVRVNSLKNWMSQHQHASIEILKLDIEGAEYDVLKAWARSTFPAVHQLLIEFHPESFQCESTSAHTCSRAEKESSIKKAAAMHAEALKSVYDAGYRLVHKPHMRCVTSCTRLKNKEVTFVKYPAEG